MFCCEIFGRLVNEAGERGFSVVACDEEGYRFFLLQARAINYSDESKMKALPANCDFPSPFTVATEMGLQYCPACGANLQEVILRNAFQFDKVVEKTKQLLL